MISFREQRAGTWGGASVIAGIMFWANGADHTLTPLADLGISVAWGLGYALLASTVVLVLRKTKA
jgi:hypothetical protein